MSAVTIPADVEYDVTLPDSVWLTVMEDLQEHFARKAAKGAAMGAYDGPVRVITDAAVRGISFDKEPGPYGGTFEVTES